MTVAWQDASYSSVDISEAAEWADYFSLTFPVFADTTGVYNDYKLTDNGRPLYVLIDRDMIIQYRGTGSSGHTGAVATLTDLL